MPHSSIVCEVASRYQHHIVLKIHLQSRYIVVDLQAATSGCIGTGMETCEVQSAVILGQLLLVYPTHDLLRSACVLKSLCDALP